MPSNIEITQSPDFSVLAAIHATSFELSWSALAFAELFAIKGTGAFIAPDNAGFGILRIIADEAEILTMAVLPDRRNHGIGRLITHAMLERARILGVKSIFLEARENNVHAQKLYHRAGFVKSAGRRNYYTNSDGSSENAVVMHKTI